MLPSFAIFRTLLSRGSLYQDNKMHINVFRLCTVWNIRVCLKNAIYLFVLYVTFTYGLFFLCRNGQTTRVSRLPGADDFRVQDKSDLVRDLFFPKQKLSRPVERRTVMRTGKGIDHYGAIWTDSVNKQNRIVGERDGNYVRGEIIRTLDDNFPSESKRTSESEHQNTVQKSVDTSKQNDPIRNERNEQDMKDRMGFNAKEARKDNPTLDSSLPKVTPRPKRCEGCFSTDFTFLMDEPELCRTYGNQTIDIVFLILTSYQGINRRNAIRETWASVTRNNTSNLRHVFLFGSTSDDKKQQDVRRESAQFRDVLVSGFHDSYNNLTLKTMMGLRWAVIRCRHARFFLKADDDVWVNTRRLLDAAEKRESLLQTRIGGMCRHTNTVIRDPHNKWYMSPDYFPYDYPPYCVGLAYVGSMNVAAGVVAVSKDVPFFLLEDVYVGLCLEAGGYGIVAIGGFQHNIPRDSNDTCMARKVISAHPVYAATMRLFWYGTCET